MHGDDENRFAHSCAPTFFFFSYFSSFWIFSWTVGREELRHAHETKLYFSPVQLLPLFRDGCRTFTPLRYKETFDGEEITGQAERRSRLWRMSAVIISLFDLARTYNTHTHTNTGLKVWAVSGSLDPLLILADGLRPSSAAPALVKAKSHLAIK